MERFDIAIVGTGPAGISAAITAKIRNKSILLLGESMGSKKVLSAESVNNYPGFYNIKGYDLSSTLLNHLKAMDISITEERINCIYAMGKFFVLKGSSGIDYESSSLILACGVNFLKHIKGEKEFLGRGVSYCATCDGMFYKSKKVCILAYEKKVLAEIQYLCEICNEVLLFKCFEDKIEYKMPNNLKVINEEPIEISGGIKADTLTTSNAEYKVDGIFILRDAVAPEELMPGIKIENNHVLTDKKMKTNIKGCFACGDVTGGPYQYIKAAGEGNVACLSAVSYLSDLEE